MMLTEKEYFVLRLGGHEYLGKIDDYTKTTSGDITGFILEKDGLKNRILISHRNIVSVDGVNDRHTIFVTYASYLPRDEAFYILGEPFVWI